MGALESLRRRERLIARVRWAAAVVVGAQVLLGAAHLWPVLAALVLLGGLVGVADRRLETTSAWRRLGGMVLVTDGLIAVAYVTVSYGSGAMSVPAIALVLLVLEGALRQRLRGGVWTAAAAGGVTALVITSVGATSPSRALGLLAGLLLVGAFAGAITLEFDVERRLFERMTVASHDIAARRDERSMLHALTTHACEVLDAPRASAWAAEPTGWVRCGSVDVGGPEGVPAPDGPPEEGAAPTAITWRPAAGRGSGRMIIPVRLPDRPASHVVVVAVPGQRPGALAEAALRSLAESTAVSLARLDVIRRQEASNRRLQRLEVLRTRFVATVAHDLRSPLTAVKGVASILRDRRDTVPRERVDAMLESVQRQANRLNRLADDLLDAARLDSDLLELKRESVDLEVLLHAVAADAEEDVHLVVDPAVPPVLGDGGRLERVAWNLVSNAIKYGRPPFVVSLSASPPDHATLEVRDHGRGLDPAQQQMLFTDFAAGGDPESVGLGLAIVWQLVGAHGGTVTYRDAEPGACFAVTLPTEGPPPEDPT